MNPLAAMNNAMKLLRVQPSCLVSSGVLEHSSGQGRDNGEPTTEPASMGDAGCGFLIFGKDAWDLDLIPISTHAVATYYKTHPLSKEEERDEETVAERDEILDIDAAVRGALGRVDTRAEDRAARWVGTLLPKREVANWSSDWLDATRLSMFELAKLQDVLEPSTPGGLVDGVPSLRRFDADSLASLIQQIQGVCIHEGVEEKEAEKAVVVASPSSPCPVFVDDEVADIDEGADMDADTDMDAAVDARMGTLVPGMSDDVGTEFDNVDF